MALEQLDIDRIETLINHKLEEWEKNTGTATIRYDIELRERIVRVEEELKHQRELMMEGFERIDKRLEAMQLEMDRRFEQIEKRFEQVDKRFEQVDKRFEQIDRRFEEVDRKFEVITRRIDRFMIWSFATTLTVGGIVIAVLKLT